MHLLEFVDFTLSRYFITLEYITLLNGAKDIVGMMQYSVT